jgi:hypothetical protein
MLEKDARALQALHEGLRERLKPNWLQIRQDHVNQALHKAKSMTDSLRNVFMNAK